MCVIIHQPKGQYIDKETCRKQWLENPDGGGFAFIRDDGQIEVYKSMEWQSYWSEFEQARSANPSRDFLLHMRIATHGSVSIANVHPFASSDLTVMAHNGIIHGVPEYENDDRTDTEVFISDVLPELPHGWQDRPYLVDMVEEWLGWSKLMFLSVDPELEHQVYRMGDWDTRQGLHYSNLHAFFPKAKTVYFGVQNRLGTGYYETSDDWNEWMDETHALDQFELINGVEQIIQERGNMQIHHPLVTLKDGHQCTGCKVIIDPFTAECECWNRVCDFCWQLLANCDMEGGCLLSNHYDYANLEKEEKQRVSDTYGQTPETTPSAEIIPLFALDREAANTE